MYQYHCLNPISQIGLDKFTENYQKTEAAEDADAILVRSASMHEMELPENLKVVARAGAGVNNIPLDRCAEKGIVVFNTPGANANAVKELVLAGMLLLAARDIIGGINWVQEYEEDGDIAKITEKKKKAFAGTELEGKKLGVIGLGAIGVLVANAATHLGMEVYGYDPYVSVDAAWKLSRNIHHAKSVDELYKECDYLTIHVPALEDTKGMINKNAISLMKDGVVILNFARDVLVNQEDIGASTEESEDNCAKMAVAEVVDYLENGNITHSVNYPDCDMGVKGKGVRITVLHRNVPNMLGQFTALLAAEGMNISLMANKSKNEYAYTMIDVESEVSEKIEKELEAVDGVLKVRIIA